MSSIVIALPKIEDAKKIRAVLERHGFTVASVCTTASNALSSASELGSGVLIDLSKYGLTYEPTVQDSIRKGADVVCFSGDKLLGGPQAGIIIGKKKYIDQMKKNQLTRALRIDKFTAAALDKTVSAYLDEGKLENTLPVYEMLGRSVEELEKLLSRVAAANF